MKLRIAFEVSLERTPKDEPEQHDSDVTSVTERADPYPLGFQPPEDRGRA